MFEYELPDVGEGVAEGEIVVWHAEPGDEVTEDEVLAEVETDKAVVDLPAPVDGVVEQLHAEAGEMVAVGSVVVTIDTEGDGGDAGGTADEATAGGAEGATAGDEAGSDATAGASGTSQEADGAEATTDTASGRVFAPPNVRRLARELGVELGAVEGSGPSGRVTEGDVRAAADGVAGTNGSAADASETPEETVDGEATTGEGSPSSADAGSTEPESAVRRRDTGAADGIESADRDLTLAVPATRGLARELDVDINEVPTERRRDGEPFVEPADVRAYAEAQQTAQAADAEAVAAASTANGSDTAETAGTRTVDTDTAVDTDAEVNTEPYRGVRRTIGEKMAESAYTAPHASHHDTAVAEGLVEAKERLEPRAEERGVRLTYTPLVMKAVAAVLPDYPAMNAQLDEENGEIVYHDRYHIGVAVATDAGLMVPVVENVDRKGLVELAAEVDDLVERARDRKLSPDELQGSTFTITNFGAIGGEYATPILNYPETGILGLGELTQRPVVEDGEVVARHTLPLSVSIDHRVVDGAVSAGFCNDLKTYLADPIHLLL